MRNIFKENKTLKLEIERLSRRIETLERENLEDNSRLREYYERYYNKQLEYEKAKYNVNIKRKKQIEKLCNSLEKKIQTTIESFMDIDIKSDVESLMLLLDYLKGE